MVVNNLLIENCKSDINEYSDNKNASPLFYVWYDVKNNTIRPIDGEMVMTSIWYDGFYFNTGMYDRETDEIILHDDIEESKCTRLSINDIDSWMMFHEPDL